MATCIRAETCWETLLRPIDTYQWNRLE